MAIKNLTPKQNPSPKAMLFARVTKRSPLRCFARSSDKAQPFPFQANLEVCTEIGARRACLAAEPAHPLCKVHPPSRPSLAQIDDGQRRAVVVLWYSAVAEYLGCVQAGDLVALANFRVRRATDFVSEFSDADLELALNSRNPVGVLRLVAEQDLDCLVRGGEEWTVAALMRAVPRIPLSLRLPFSSLISSSAFSRTRTTPPPFHQSQSRCRACPGSNYRRLPRGWTCSYSARAPWWTLRARSSTLVRLSPPRDKASTPAHTQSPAAHFITAVALPDAEERRRIKGGFILYRWITLQDHSSDRPVGGSPIAELWPTPACSALHNYSLPQMYLQLAYNSNMDTFYDVQRGHILVASNCRVRVSGAS